MIALATHRSQARALRSEPVDDFVDADRGLSIVEVIVALMLLGLGILGLSASLATANKSTAASFHRIEASRLASSEIERARVLPYSEISIAPDSVGFVAAHDGRSTVSASTSTPADSLLTPTKIVSSNETFYSIRTHLTWQPLSTGGQLIPEGYKVISLIVTWADSAGPHQVELNSGLYERGST